MSIGNAIGWVSGIGIANLPVKPQTKMGVDSDLLNSFFVINGMFVAEWQSDGFFNRLLALSAMDKPEK